MSPVAKNSPAMSAGGSPATPSPSTPTPQHSAGRRRFALDDCGMPSSPPYATPMSSSRAGQGPESDGTHSAQLSPANSSIQQKLDFAAAAQPVTTDTLPEEDPETGGNGRGYSATQEFTLEQAGGESAVQSPSRQPPSACTSPGAGSPRRGPHKSAIISPPVSPRPSGSSLAGITDVRDASTGAGDVGDSDHRRPDSVRKYYCDLPSSTMPSSSSTSAQLSCRSRRDGSDWWNQLQLSPSQVAMPGLQGWR